MILKLITFLLFNYLHFHPINDSYPHIAHLTEFLIHSLFFVLYQVYFINHQIIIIKNELMEIIDLYDLNLNYFSINQFTLNHLIYINNHYPFLS